MANTNDDRYVLRHRSPDMTAHYAKVTAMTPPVLKPGRFRAPDKLMAMLSTAGRKPKYAE
jgi:hypothetical protein